MTESSRSGDSGTIEGSIARLPFAMVLTDPRIEDNPIVYVNDAFERMTLYSRAFAVGRNCRFLQGDAAAPADVETIRTAIAEGRDVSVDIDNQKADGTTFRNRLVIAPLRSESGELTGFLGMQTDLDAHPRTAEAGGDGRDLMLREVQHRVKNHLAMIVSMIRLQAERKVTRESFEALSHRIESLALLYDELSGRGVAAVGDTTIAAGAYLSRVAAALAAIDGRGSIRINVECEEIELPVEITARLGLLLTEFLTNALEHAFKGRNEGVVRIRFQKLTGGGVRLMVEDDGVGLREGSNWPWDADSVEAQASRTQTEPGELDTTGHDGASGMGGSIVAALVQSLGAKLDVNTATRGTVITLDLET
ncbi:PAS domain-containing protein [Parvularcula dongshanensis]|uniref:histidine kinase n=1 Tax=Parvularcula dongshanensis TaxID=1173995 RepID=A0A840HZI6_9PROT|nr:PAS domain-containing protein [Parvularcula dongshanensis]MBB4658256.1 PAS domain S-box-containing protein [Parvularcula dongshanensis]